MRQIDILKLSIYQIQMFLSVANSESITISSRNLHLSPSMLSKNISKIEDELGLILFLREKGRLRVTPAGKVLQRELSMAIEIIEQGIQKAQAQQAVKANPLRIGFPDSCSQNILLPRSIKDFKSKTEGFDYNVEFYQFRNLPVEIEHGNLDVIFTTLFEEPSIKEMGLKHEVILRYPLTIHVTEESPLAKQQTVSIDDLTSMRLVLPSPLVVPNYYEGVIRHLFRSRSAVPQISYFATSSDAVVANIKAPDEIFISDASRKVESFYELIRIPIEDTESGIILAWNPVSHPQAQRFAENTIRYWKENKDLII